MSHLEYLTELDAAHKRRVAAIKAEESLTKPVISDPKRIGEVYALFNRFLPLVSPRDAKDPENRRVFIFICLMLFCPKAFAGNVITYGVCEEMSRVLNCHRSLISHNVRNLKFTYRKYKDFRDKVDTIFDEIDTALKQKD